MSASRCPPPLHSRDLPVAPTALTPKAQATAGRQRPALLLSQRPLSNLLKNGERGQALHSQVNPFPQLSPAQAIFSHFFFFLGWNVFLRGWFGPSRVIKPPFHFSSLPTPCVPPPQPSSRRRRSRFPGRSPTARGEAVSWPTVFQGPGRGPREERREGVGSPAASEGRGQRREESRRAGRPRPFRRYL